MAALACVFFFYFVHLEHIFLFLLFILTPFSKAPFCRLTFYPRD